MVKAVGTILLIIAVVSIGVVMMQRSVVEMSYSGRPFDHPGEAVTCQKCKAAIADWTKRGYAYKCRECGGEFRVRINKNAPQGFDMDW